MHADIQHSTGKKRKAKKLKKQVNTTKELIGIAFECLHNVQLDSKVL